MLFFILQVELEGLQSHILLFILGVKSSHLAFKDIWWKKNNQNASSVRGSCTSGRRSLWDVLVLQWAKFIKGQHFVKKKNNGRPLAWGLQVSSLALPSPHPSTALLRSQYTRFSWCCQPLKLPREPLWITELGCSVCTLLHTLCHLMDSFNTSYTLLLDPCDQFCTLVCKSLIAIASHQGRGLELSGL